MYIYICAYENPVNCCDPVFLQRRIKKCSLNMFINVNKKMFTSRREGSYSARIQPTF